MKPKHKIISIVSLILFFLFVGISFYIPRTEYRDNRTAILTIIGIAMTSGTVASYIGLFVSSKKDES